MDVLLEYIDKFVIVKRDPINMAEFNLAVPYIPTLAVILRALISGACKFYASDTG